jgi:hypothetical protein
MEENAMRASYKRMRSAIARTPPERNPHSFVLLFLFMIVPFLPQKRPLPFRRRFRLRSRNGPS